MAQWPLGRTDAGFAAEVAVMNSDDEVEETEFLEEADPEEDRIAWVNSTSIDLSSLDS